MKKIIKKAKTGFQMEVKDPFIISFHHKDRYPCGNGLMEPFEMPKNWNRGNDFDESRPWRMYHGEGVPGFPEHPHKGFETITVVTEGFVDHFDSKGSKGRYGQGDVQWMSAGDGCRHSEMFPLLSQTEENPLELFQIWINLSAAGKKTGANYKMLWDEEIPVITEKDASGNETTIRLIAGEYKGQFSVDPLPNSWAYDRKHHVGVWLIKLSANAEFTIPKISPTAYRALFFYDGKESMHVEDEVFPNGYNIQLNAGEDVTLKNGSTDSYVLMLQGEPIGEPVAAYGPFVMNTREELVEAYEEYNKTGFGGWQWGRHDPVNALADKRFASYFNGESEVYPESKNE